MLAWLTNLFSGSEGAGAASTASSAATTGAEIAAPAATQGGLSSAISSLLDPETLAAGVIKSMGGQGALDAAYSISAGNGGWGNLFANMATKGGYGSIGDAFTQAAGGAYKDAFKSGAQGLQAISGGRGSEASGPQMPGIPHYDNGPGGNISKMLGGIMRAI